jgi:hypothetical protein
MSAAALGDQGNHVLIGRSLSTGARLCPFPPDSYICRRGPERFIHGRLRHKPRATVNLNLAHTLLVAANEQPYGFLKVRSLDLIHEVELMAAAGLVDASFGNANTIAFAVINRVTEPGQAFLRVFKDEPPPRMGIARILESAET